MSPSLASLLLPQLRSRFPAHGLHLDPEGAPFAIFEAAHPEVGNVEIYDDGDELTLVLGNFTHTHFSSYDEGLCEAEQGRRIADSVVDFLEELFADRVELFGTHLGTGGFRLLSDGKRGIFSKVFFGRKSYVWSGPLEGEG